MLADLCWLTRLTTPHAMHAQLVGTLLTSAEFGRCRAVGASMQGAVTAACMVATAAVQAAEHPLPQTLLVQCPADIRQQVSLLVIYGPSARVQAKCMYCTLLAGLFASASRTGEDTAQRPPKW